MNNADIGLLGVAASGLLIAVAVGVSIWRQLGLEATIAWAALRALAQLLVVGVALQFVVDDDDPLVYAFIWLAVMHFFAAYTTYRRARQQRMVFALALLAYLASSTVTLGVLFGFGVYEPTGRTIVPLAGIVIGNSLAATVLVTNRLFAAANERRIDIEGRLALGLNAADAFRPTLRDALRTALIPQVETTKAVGIIALPGAMVGLILAGADPQDAVRVQVSVMYLVLGSVATTTAVMSLGLARQLFTPAQQLKRFD